METKTYEKVSVKTKLMLIRLASIRPKIGTVSEISGLLGINYENAKAIYRTYRLQNRMVKVGKRSDRLARAKDIDGAAFPEQI